MLQINAVPGSSVPDVNQTTLMFNSADTDANSSGLYFLKDPTLGSQNWLRLATTNQLGASKSFSYPTRALNTAFQPSASRDASVAYSIDVACTLSLSGGQTGTVFLEICSNSSFSSGVQEICRFVNGNTGTLTVGLNITQDVTSVLSGFVPAGYYARIRTANTSGTPTFAFRSGQETLI